MRTRLVIGIAVLLAIVVVLGLVLSGDDDGGSDVGGDDPAGSSETSVDDLPSAGALLELSGTGADQTDVFEAAENWELRWSTAAAGPFTIELFAEDGTSRGVIVEESAETAGSVFVSEAGTFYLGVKTGGEWSIEIIGRPPD